MPKSNTYEFQSDSHPDNCPNKIEQNDINSGEKNRRVSKIISGKEFMLDLSFLSFFFGLMRGFFEWRCDMIEM